MEDIQKQALALQSDWWARTYDELFFKYISKSEKDFRDSLGKEKK